MSISFSGVPERPGVRRHPYRAPEVSVLANLSFRQFSRKRASWAKFRIQPKPSADVRRVFEVKLNQRVYMEMQKAYNFLSDECGGASVPNKEVE